MHHYVEQRFIGIHSLFHTDLGIAHHREGGIGVVLFIECHGLFAGEVGVEMRHGEYAAWEVAAHRHEDEPRIAAGLQLAQGHTDFGEMLMGEWLVDRQIVVAPAEVGCGSGLHTGTGASGHGGDAYLAVGEQSGSRQREQRELQGGGEATGIGHGVGPGYEVAVHLGQTVDVALAAVAVILGEIYYLQSGRTCMTLPEFPALAMGRAEEEDVDILKGMGVGESEPGVAEQVGMYGRHRLPGMAGGVHEGYLYTGMVYEKAQEFAGCITGASYYSYFLHYICVCVCFTRGPGLLGFAVLHLIVVIDFHLVAHDFCESLHIIGCPCFIYLAILAEVGLHQIEG